MQNNKRTGFAGWMRDKGYYIVLVLCVAAVGISGYLYFSQSTTPDAEAAAAAATEENAVTAPTEESAGSTASEDGQAPLELQRPIVGEVAETFATDRLAYNATTQDWRVHNGIDLAAAQGTPIYATRAGKVTRTSYQAGGAGNYVSINHLDGFSSIFMHMTHYVVSQGQDVSQGQLIGYVGSTGISTGPHLHFGISYAGTYVNPLAYIY